MKIQVKINKKPFDRIQIIRLLKACDKSLSLKEAKDIVEKEIEHKVADVDDILEFDLPNGSIVNVNFHDYNPNGEFDIIAAQGDVLKSGTFVLIRDTDDEKWMLGVFSHYNNNENTRSNYPYVVLGEKVYAKCIPLEGNEHLVDKDYPANTSPIPEEPKYDNEKKRYRIVFGNEVVDYTDQELYNFITTAVLHNRDICMFTVIDTENISRR